jgi:Xaa-Pro dipeptidase
LHCHDVGCALVRPQPSNPFLRNTSTIVAGQCFTIEPGVYFIEPLLAPLREGPQAAGVDWALVGELRKFGGVRIEDDLIVVGGEQITRNLTREVLPQ